MTTGSGVEGEPGQHVVATLSQDQGASWSPLIDIEPADGPEASWVMPVLGSDGRIYAIYNYNADNIREVPVDADFDGGRDAEGVSSMARRVDTLGKLMMKYSDDGGRSWSQRRYEIPVREFAIDRTNPFEGKVRFMWAVGKPISHRGSVYFGCAKVGRFGRGFMASTEGVFLRSDNLLTEPDPAKVVWTTLPDGDIGLRSPHESVSDEHNLVGLSDGSLYCTYRTVTGHPCHAYSRDSGHTWTAPVFMSYRPGGRLVKHPRAANFVKKMSGGQYLYWFHNNGTRWYNHKPSEGNRNVVWICGGVERDGPEGKVLHWSEPEILLYEPEFRLGASYPDFIEEGSDIYITCTQKLVARTIQVDRKLLEDMWRQTELREFITEGLLVETGGVEGLLLPVLSPRLAEGGGFAIELRLRIAGPCGYGVLAHNLSEERKGFTVEWFKGGVLRLTLNDGAAGCFWETDAGMLDAAGEHHVVFNIDGGPRVISCVVDGVLCDGGELRAYGWGRIPPQLKDVNAGPLFVTSVPGAEVRVLRIYERYLRTSEAISNYRSGR